MTKKFLYFLTFLILVSLLVPVLTRTTLADEFDECEEILNEDKQQDCYEDLVDKYQKKADNASAQVSTLQGELANLDAQVNLTQARIQNTVAEIAKRTRLLEQLEVDIGNLAGRIENISGSIDHQQGLLNERMRERYKSGADSPFIVLFGSSTLNTLLKKTEYLRVLGLQDQQMLDEMNRTKTAYTQQKDLLQEKKEETEKLKAEVEGERVRLEAYNEQLADQKEQKDNLLAQTQNDEAIYQELLQRAQLQTASFKIFTSSSGLGVIGANGLGKGKEGWYFSQRDSRWAHNRIGSSSENVLNVGCLVSSVAMVYRSYGADVTPASIAARPSNFYGSTAYLLQKTPTPGAPSGKTYKLINKGSIDGYLEDGDPVIVGVNLYGDAVPDHFVVLADKKGGDYVLYDPLHGPDLKFSQYYSFGSIVQVIVFD